MNEFIENLEDNFFDFHKHMRDKIFNSWKRVLPFNDEFTDRWEKARYLGFGEGTSIYDSSVVLGDVKVGKNSWIGPYTLLDGSGGLKIGDYCHISCGVQIYSHDTVKWVLTGGKHPYEKCGTEVGNNCHVGSMSIIYKGVKIGNHCVVGANSFVNRDIPDYSIAAGTPAVVIGKIIIEDDKVRFVYNK